ncbi:MAG: heavy metal translocating P-type ATPase [Bacilli bacterium]|nr:heavy metal translocating P-type ATPase [Bacilli bacterium]
MPILERKITGVTCLDCANHAQQNIKKIEGVKNVEIDFLQELISIEFNNRVDINYIEPQIESILKKYDIKFVEKESIDSKKENIKKFVFNYRRIFMTIFSGIFLMGGLLTKNSDVRIVLFVISYLISGTSVIIKSIKNILKGEVFDENFLMMIATIGAFIIGEELEAVAVMVFYQLGEFFQDLAIDKSRRSIKKLIDLKPNNANLIKDGKVIKIQLETVKKGDYILVKPGEKIPLDGIVRKGDSSLNLAFLTGESLPQKVEVNNEVLAGSVNIDGVLEIEVNKKFSETTFAKILELVESAASKKSKSEKFITKFAKYYTPIVVFLAILLAFVPLLFNQPLTIWGYRALVFLVISCPCALVISIPLSFFAGIGASSRNKILIKGGEYLEKSAKINTLVLDKTGTITKGSFDLGKINLNEVSEDEFLLYLSNAEYYSNHPIAKFIVGKFSSKINKDKIKDYKEIKGFGSKLIYDNKKVVVGKKELLLKNGIKVIENDVSNTIVYLGVDGKYYGNVLIEDAIKLDMEQSIKNIQAEGVNNIVMLTGDNEKVASEVAKKVGITEYYANMLPEEKIEIVERLKKEGKKIAFIGDGINDAPVLALSGLGISMGGIGADVAIEASDIVFIDDDISKTVTLIRIAKKTSSIVKTNIFMILSIKLLVLILGALGIATMWMAIFADVGVSLIAILLSIRILRYTE